MIPHKAVLHCTPWSRRTKEEVSTRTKDHMYDDASGKRLYAHSDTGERGAKTFARFVNCSRPTQPFGSCILRAGTPRFPNATLDALHLPVARRNLSTAIWLSFSLIPCLSI